MTVKLKSDEINNKRTEITMFFWNIGKKDLTDSLNTLLNESPMDILIFSEANISIRESLNKTLLPLGYKSRTPLKGAVRVSIFDRLPNVIYCRVDQYQTFIIYELLGMKVLVVGIHLLSPISAPIDDRYVDATKQNENIERIEAEWGIDKTIVIGDFNMNPFDKGMVSEKAFKATHCKQTVLSNRTKKPYYFNPSWRAFSNDLTLEGNNAPPGTIHFIPRNKDSDVNFWHIFDQVLIRSKLFSELSDRYQILFKWNKHFLLTDNLIPNRLSYSDHLPIKYTINLQAE
ncbi:hypothetical protein GC101_01005 [Paenibacillus sp. LMG 31459]|uniref:Endonuclease/exonuclease/phosphatase domain-containing protein n=1 Tax=Paenibacillus phytohabitans TaxID=2654978 RepID=A0ABX1YB72_9BACL|nr:endonuclease/exonuclease/phosphatase family protein [Paenibacillus phytohabitans]NOU77451.1 hypothetical protein [Paenibacillus phytohabitans]